jgi:hypothetical protein
LLNEQDSLAERAKSLKGGETVEIHGFASEEGGKNFNLNLSCARAHAALDVLKKVSPGTNYKLFAHGAVEGDRDFNRSVVVQGIPAPAPAPGPEPNPPPPTTKSYAQMARDGVVKALKLINPDQDETSNIVPYDGNNAEVKDPSKIDTSSWSSTYSGHADAREKGVPGYDGLQVKIYFKDKERGNLTTIGLIHTGASHVLDYVFNYDAKDRSNHTNADIAKDFCAKVEGGCP